MYFRDIDRSTPEGQQALAVLAVSAGAALADVARGMQRLFMLGSPWAPGLWFVGGQTAFGQTVGDGAHGSFSVGGGGVTLEAALASCVGEALERTALIEHAGDIAASHPLDAEQNFNADGAVLAHSVLAVTNCDAATSVDWVDGFDLRTGKAIRCPADWVLRRALKGPLIIPDAALSTGTAAGPTRDAAKMSAVLELIERDAAALWWRGGRPARLLTLDAASMQAAAHHLAILRRGSNARTTRLFDITTDIGIPVVAADSTNAAGQAFSCGLGCRPTRVAAAISALTELCQSEIGLQFATQKGAELGDAALSTADRGHLARAQSVTFEQMPWYAAPILPDPGVPDQESGAWLAEHLHTHGVSAAVFDATRGTVPVFKIIAPLLQPYPGRVGTDRLQCVRREFGGGNHWTSDVSLT